MRIALVAFMSMMSGAFVTAAFADEKIKEIGRCTYGGTGDLSSVYHFGKGESGRFYVQKFMSQSFEHPRMSHNYASQVYPIDSVTREADSIVFNYSERPSFDKPTQNCKFKFTLDASGQANGFLNGTVVTECGNLYPAAASCWIKETEL